MAIDIEGNSRTIIPVTARPLNGSSAGLVPA
jgi:hypothetical protein